MASHFFFSNRSFCLIPDVDIHITENFDINIRQPLVLPLAFLGALVGFFHFEKFSKLTNTRGSWIYATTAFLFGCMNTAGIFVNCFFPPNLDMSPASTASYIFGLIDGTCTSCVSFSFILCALVDIRLLDDTKCYFRTIVYVIYAALGVGWVQIEQGWTLGFLFLYLLLTIVGVAGYSLVTFLWFFIHSTFRGLGILLLAIVSGAVGIQILLHQEWVCDHFGPLFSSISLWYLASDTSFFLLCLFFFSTRSLRKYDLSLPQFDDYEEIDEENELHTSQPSNNEELSDVTNLLDTPDHTPTPYYGAQIDNFVGETEFHDQQSQPQQPQGQTYYYYDLNTNQWIPQQDCYLWTGKI